MVRPTKENFAPYAPTKAVIDVVRRYRERGLPDPLTATDLERVGVPMTMTGLTLKALVFLQLVDEGGNRCEAFESIRRASTNEYPEIFAEIIRKAYLPIFTIIDPAQDDEIAIADAFRRYDPANQRQKMIRLFRGLCEEAGIIQPREKRRQVSVRKQQPKPSKGKVETAQPKSSATQNLSDIKKEEESQSIQGDIATDYRLISAVIQQLPRERYWTSEKRKLWLDAMTSSIDLIIEVREDGEKEVKGSDQGS